MTKKITIVDLGYHYAKEISDYRELIDLYASASGQHEALAEQADLHVIRHLNQEISVKINAVQYSFFKGSSSAFWLPFRLHAFIKKLQPDIILLHGFYDPLKILLLSLQTKAKLVIQYHGGAAPTGLKAFLQRRLKNKVRNYIFTSAQQANALIEKGLIHPASTIYEIMEGSTYKKRIPKTEARNNLDIDAQQKMFLWVGRLDKNKDPLTILKGFEAIAQKHVDAYLYMLYGEDALLNEVQAAIKSSEVLTQKVKLLGKLPHNSLDNYYCSADYFVLGSHYEGSGFALCEALACGCIPVVTDIPSFRTMTGQLGSLWQCGDAGSFISAAESVLKKDPVKESAAAVAFFEKELSFAAIAKKQGEMMEQILLA